MSEAVALIYTVHDLSRGKNVASVSDPLCTLLPRATRLLGLSSSPSPCLSSSSYSSAADVLLLFFLTPSFRASAAREFSGESRFLIYDRSRYGEWATRGGGGGNETERVEAGFPLSFISSHFRRSPRYPVEFTTYRIYRSDAIPTYVADTSRGYRDGGRRRGGCASK